MGPPPTASASSKLAAGAAASHEDLTPMEVFRKALTPNGRWNKVCGCLFGACARGCMLDYSGMAGAAMTHGGPA